MSEWWHEWHSGCVAHTGSLPGRTTREKGALGKRDLWVGIFGGADFDHIFTPEPGIWTLPCALPTG